MDPNQAIRSARTRVKQTSTPAGRKAAGVFSLEGNRCLERALRADIALSQAWFSSTAMNTPDERENGMLALIEQRGIPCHALPDEVMSELTAGRKFGSCIALAPLPEPSFVQEPGVYVVGVDIVDPGNVGAMIRTALAAGARGFIPVGTTDPWHPKAVRTSMGSIFKLPICTPDETTFSSGQRLGLTLSTDAIPLNKVAMRGDHTFLFMGSEAFGLSEDLIQQLDTEVRIPMVAGVDSYSVNVATGIALYQLLHGYGSDA